MSETKDEKREIPNFILQATPAQGSLEIFLGNNLITGSPLVGDRIKLQDGRTFVVTQRTWLDGRDRQANMAIRLAEEPSPTGSPAPSAPASPV